MQFFRDLWRWHYPSANSVESLRRKPAPFSCNHRSLPVNPPTGETIRPLGRAQGTPVLWHGVIVIFIVSMKKRNWIEWLCQYTYWLNIAKSWRPKRYGSSSTIASSNCMLVMRHICLKPWLLRHFELLGFLSAISSAQAQSGSKNLDGWRARCRIWVESCFANLEMHWVILGAWPPPKKLLVAAIIHSDWIYWSVLEITCFVNLSAERQQLTTRPLQDQQAISHGHGAPVRPLLQADYCNTQNCPKSLSQFVWYTVRPWNFHESPSG